MKILIKIRANPQQMFLVELPQRKIVKEIGALLCKGEYSGAITAALSGGKRLREIAREDFSRVDADLILTEENASYDLL